MPRPAVIRLSSPGRTIACEPTLSRCSISPSNSQLTVCRPVCGCGAPPSRRSPRRPAARSDRRNTRRRSTTATSAARSGARSSPAVRRAGRPAAPAPPPRQRRSPGRPAPGVAPVQTISAGFSSVFVMQESVGPCRALRCSRRNALRRWLVHAMRTPVSSIVTRSSSAASGPTIPSIRASSRSTKRPPVRWFPVVRPGGGRVRAGSPAPAGPSADPDR